MPSEERRCKELLSSQQAEGDFDATTTYRANGDDAPKRNSKGVNLFNTVGRGKEAVLSKEWVADEQLLHAVDSACIEPTSQICPHTTVVGTVYASLCEFVIK